MSAHTTHCCPVHGCKYGNDLKVVGDDLVEAKGGCPVSDGAEKPAYPNNNGCEPCEHDAEWRESVLSSLRVKEYFNIGFRRPDGSAFPAGISEVGWLKREVAEDKVSDANAEVGEERYVVVSRYMSDWA